MTRMASLGFVGCGTHATNNLFPMIKYARARLQAACDLKAELAELNARIYGAPASHTSVDEMLSAGKLDGVVVCGPPALHHEAGLKVLARGLPLFVEKPPAPSLAQTREMVALARKNGTFLMTGFMKRHGLAYRKIRAFINEGRFQPASGFFRYTHWASKGNLKDMLAYMCIHPIDLAISFFGDVDEVVSVLDENALGLSLALTLRFRSGRIAQLMLGSAVRIQEHVEITGRMDGKGALFVVDNVHHMELHTAGEGGTDLSADLSKINPTFNLDDIKVWRPDFGIPNMGQNSPWLVGYALEIREFVDAILEKREPYPGTEDSLKAMEVIDAVAARPNGTSPLGSRSS